MPTSRVRNRKPSPARLSAQQNGSARRGGIAAWERSRPAKFLIAAEKWTSAHLDWFIWPIAAIALVLRIQRGAGTFLDGDETQIMFPPIQHSIAKCYEAAKVFPYGPFGNFLLYFLAKISTAELYLRLPSIISGALIPVVAYRWVAYRFNKSAGFVTACLLAFSPPLINLSAQVRHYTIHMLWIACSLYCLERALREESLKWLRWFGAALLLALLTMYMSVWYTAGIGLYALMRVALGRPPRRFVIEWAAFQVAAVVICAVAYVTLLAPLRGSASEAYAREFWLRDSYYHPESQSLYAYISTANQRLFGYLFANSNVADVAICVFVAGVIIVLFRVRGGRWAPAFAIVLPVVATMLAGVLGIYPYGGSRHDAYLGIFIAAGIAIAIAYICRSTVLPVVLAAAVVVPLWQRNAQRHYLDDPEDLHQLRQMTSALAYLHSRTPSPRVLVVDGQGTAMANYYVCRGNVSESRTLLPNLTSYRCGAYQIIAVPDWAATPATLMGALADARHSAPGQFPGPAWIFQMSVGGGSVEGSATDSIGIFGRVYMQKVSDQ